MAQVVDIPGVGRVEFPDNMGPDDIAAAAGRLTRQQDGPMVHMPRPTRSIPSRPSLSDIFASGGRLPRMPGFNAYGLFENLFGPLPSRDPEAFARETLPALGATAGSAAFPAAGVVRGLPLLQRLASVFPGIAGAGAGGAAGGAAGGLLEGDEDIAGAALESGARMAGAEVLGRGATGIAARAVAPAVGLLDDAGRKALEFARNTTIPGERTPVIGAARRPGIAPASVAPGGMQRAIQGAADYLIPSRLITTAQRRRVTEKVLALPTDAKNELLARLVGADTSDAALVTSRTVADKVSKAIGVRESTRLGYGNKEGARQFLNRLLREGDPVALKKRLSPADYDSILEKGLESLIVQSSRRTQGGRRVIDGQALSSTWENLPKEIRELYPAPTREAMTSFAAFARASQFVPEAFEKGVLTAPTIATTAGVGLTGGPAVLAFDPTATATAAIGSGIAALTAKSLMNPRGLLNRYLTNDKLAPDVMRVAGREITKLIPRHMLSAPPDDEPDLGELGVP